MRARAGLALPLAALGVAAALSAAPAWAEPKVIRNSDPSRYTDPSYDPAAHGGLPYATYLRVTRGRFPRSTGMMIAGIVLVSVGATTMAIGSGVYAAAGGCSNEPPSFDGGFSDPCSARTGHASGMAILITGTIAAGLGIPLWIVGASGVPWAEAATNDRAPASPAWARLVPAMTPAAAGRGVALTWQF